MVAYRKLFRTEQDDEAETPSRARPKALSHELLHGLTPAQFEEEARALDNAKSLTAAGRARLRAQLTERLKTSVDAPSWGPDWVRHGERHAPKYRSARPGLLDRMRRKDEDAPQPAVAPEDLDDAHAIARNLEKSRQVHHYRWLYLLAAVLALSIALLAMFVDYQIIRGDVWTRALSNEFMVVPAALKSSVMFKSLQVLFAVLIVHFMLKITGVYGRNTLITAAFIMAILMVVSLGYLVAYNNMAGATSATYENSDSAALSSGNSIDQLFSSVGRQRRVSASSLDTGGMEEASLPVPKLSKDSLANADSWVWFGFASMIFFIVTAVAALYMLIVENNVRNLALARDYPQRRRQFTQLHMLDLADAQKSHG
jgi:hypothetical protein